MTAAERGDVADWPEALLRLEAVIGRDKTIELADAFGGLDRIYIPREPTEAHLWRRVLGDELWRAVVAAFGGERIDLPRGVFLQLRKRQILDLAAEGVPHRQIVLRVRCTERYVRRVLEGMPEPADPRQGKLFE